MERTGKKYGLISMCIGTGMGAAGVFEREWHDSPRVTKWKHTNIKISIKTFLKTYILL